MAYSCIVVLRFVTRYSDTKIGIWRFLYRHDDLLKKRISDFLAICAIKSDKKSPQIGQKSPKIAKNQHADFWRFLLVLCVTFALAQVTNKLIKKNLSLVTSYSIFIITPFFLVLRGVTIEKDNCTSYKNFDFFVLVLFITII